MNKILRYSFIAVLALICNVSFADAYKTLTFPDDNSENNKVGAYDKTWTAKIGNDSWSISNFNNNEWKNNWKYIKCGRKNTKSTGTIATDFAMDKAISSVVVTIDNITTEKVNSISLVVSSDKEGTQKIETITANKLTRGEMLFTIKNPTANSYYQLVFDCQEDSKNGIVVVSKVEYYKEGDTPEIVDITNTPETAYTVAKAHELIKAGEGLGDKVYVKGKITTIDNIELEKYFNATYTIADNATDTKNGLVVFRGFYIGGEKFSSKDQIKVGDDVIIYGNLKDYNGTHEFDAGNQIYSLNGTTTNINNITTDATSVNAPAYNLAGQKVSASYKGVVIKAGKKYIQK